MKKGKDRIDKLEHSLGDIYRRNANERADAGDVDLIMRRARRLPRPGTARAGAGGTGGAMAESLALIEARRIFARFAAGASLAAACAMVYALTAGYGPEYELLRIYALDPAGMLIMPLFGA
jgi:hypothetical protein